MQILTDLALFRKQSKRIKKIVLLTQKKKRTRTTN